MNRFSTCALAMLIVAAVTRAAPATAHDVPFPVFSDPNVACDTLAKGSDVLRNECLRENQGGYDGARLIWDRVSDFTAKHCSNFILSQNGQNPWAYKTFYDCLAEFYWTYDRPRETAPPFRTRDEDAPKSPAPTPAPSSGPMTPKRNQTPVQSISLICSPMNDKSTGQSGSIKTVNVSVEDRKWTVEHISVSGRVHDRTKQYDLRDTTFQNDFAWSGRYIADSTLKMVGKIVKEDGAYYYVETLYDMKFNERETDKTRAYCAIRPGTAVPSR